MRRGGVSIASNLELPMRPVNRNGRQSAPSPGRNQSHCPTNNGVDYCGHGVGGCSFSTSHHVTSFPCEIIRHFRILDVLAGVDVLKEANHSPFTLKIPHFDPYHPFLLFLVGRSPALPRSNLWSLRVPHVSLRVIPLSLSQWRYPRV